MAITLNKDANITKSNSDISEEILFGAPTGGSFLMDVSVDGHAELIQELTDASRDKGAYAIREAVSNAFDATIKSGDPSRPVEVTIPVKTSMYPSHDTLAGKLELIGDRRLYVSVTDHGIGMTAEELRENFAQYGNSDKRGSGAIGSKGLGSKAPLACADFFEVTSTKGGVTTSMLLWREDGGNYAKIVSEKRTRKASGTTVRIPVTDEATRLQMERQLTLIAGWNTQFNLVAKIGGTTLGTDPEHRLGTEVGHAYEVPMGFAKPSYSWYGTQMTLTEQKFLYMGKVEIARSSAGEPVLVDVWRNYESIEGDVNEKDGFADHTSIDINLMGVRYPLLRDGSVGSSNDMSTSHVDYIIGCEPGYLNFTVSRDDIKEDDAWRLFVSSLRDGMAGFDQRPALIEHVMGLTGVRERYTFLRRRGVELYHDGNGYSVAGLTVSDDKAHAMFSETDKETGEVIDMTDLMFIHKGEQPGQIRILVNDSGSMHGIGTKPVSSGRYWGRPQSKTGYCYGTPFRLSPKEIRFAVSEAAARPDCAALLATVGDKPYTDSSSCGGLDVVILTNVGEGCSRIATADKSIRKYVCAERQRPQDVSMVYVLCEGDYEPDDAEMTILEWFRSWSIAKFDDYMKECKSGILLREKKKREEREKAERKARMSQTYRIMMSDAPTIMAGPCDRVLGRVADGSISEGTTFVYSYANAYQMTSEDAVAILNELVDTSREAIRIAWMLLESSGVVRDANGDTHRRLYVVSASTAKEMGIYDMGDERKFDILFDETGALEGLLPKGIRFDDHGILHGSVDDFGLSGSSPNLIAAMLRCEGGLYRHAVGSFYRIAGTTGNRDLDSVISKTKLEPKWVNDSASYSYYRGMGEHRFAIRIEPSAALARRYEPMRGTAERLTELWNKGIGDIARNATHQNPARHSLPKGMSYAVLQKAMAALA